MLCGKVSTKFAFHSMEGIKVAMKFALRSNTIWERTDLFEVQNLSWHQKAGISDYLIGKNPPVFRLVRNWTRPVKGVASGLCGDRGGNGEDNAFRSSEL